VESRPRPAERSTEPQVVRELARVQSEVSEKTTAAVLKASAPVSPEIREPGKQPAEPASIPAQQAPRLRAGPAARAGLEQV
jgi:hypothetical protein